MNETIRNLTNQLTAAVINAVKSHLNTRKGRIALAVIAVAVALDLPPATTMTVTLIIGAVLILAIAYEDGKRGPVVTTAAPEPLTAEQLAENDDLITGPPVTAFDSASTWAPDFGHPDDEGGV